MKKILVLMLIAMVSFGVFANGETEDAMVGGFLRSETMFLTGGMWAVPTSFNPITWSVPAGLRGFVYESLFFYDPLTNTMKPWVANSYEWDGNTLVLEINEAAMWSDGTPLTAEDVAFTFEYPAWSNPFGELESVSVEGNVVRVTFPEPNYHSIQLQLYTWPVIKKAYWEAISPDEAVSAEVNPLDRLGSGPYVIEAVDQDRVIYLRNDEWWGIEGLGIDFPAKRCVYLKNMSNNVAMALLAQGTELDMANNYIPGTPVAKSTNPNLHTWYEGAPYMLPDNVVFLMPNCTIEPFNDVDFRKAMAYAINPAEICEIAFEDMATPTNSLGITDIPAWNSYYNEDIDADLGFSYDPSMAASLLDQAGYVDADGDGWRDHKDGSPLNFDLSVPYGWTDWMGGARLIVEQLNAVGINCDVDFPDEGRWQTNMVKGEFELILQNWGSYISHSPHTLYQYLFSTITPIGQDEWTGNFGRYDNPDLMDLVYEFGSIPVEDTAAANEIVRQIQTIHMQEMPYIPVWTNGMWFAANESVWTNWPGEDTTNKHYPSLFTDKLQIGGLLMLSELELAD